MKILPDRKERGLERRGHKSRGNKFLRYGAQTPNGRLRGHQNGIRYLFLCPRRRSLGRRPHSVGIYSHGFLPHGSYAHSFLAHAVLLLCLLSLAPIVRAQASPVPLAIDRAAVYQTALPAYQYDATQPLAVKVVETHTIGSVKFQRFSYLSTNAQRVPALLFLPPGASAAHPVPCLVLLHGLGGSKEMMAGLALFLASKGDASLAIDEYGQGERPKPKAADTPQAQAQQLATTVQQTAIDVRRGLDYLATRPDIDRQKIGLTGISLGAIIGTVTAGVDTRVKAAALISGGGDWGLILKTLAARNAVVGGRKTAAFKSMDWAKLSVFLAPEDPLTFAPQIAPRALLMLGGRQDTTIVPQSQQELFDAARTPKQIVWFPQYGHVPPPEAVNPALAKFFAARL